MADWLIRQVAQRFSTSSSSSTTEVETALVVCFLFLVLHRSVQRDSSALYLPIFFLLLQDLHPQKGLSFSAAIVLGSQLTEYALSFSKRHPKADRSLILYDLVFLLQPSLWLGALAGVLLNLIFPLSVSLTLSLSWLTLSLRELSFFWSAIGCCFRGRETLSSSSSSEPDSCDEASPLEDSPPVNENVNDSCDNSHEQKRIDEDDEEIADILSKEAEDLPFGQTCILLFLWFSFLALVSLSIKNPLTFWGDSTPNWPSNWSSLAPFLETDLHPSFPLFSLSFCLFFFVIHTVMTSRSLYKTYKTKVSKGYPFVEKDPHWTIWGILAVQPVAFFFSLFASLSAVDLSLPLLPFVRWSIGLLSPVAKTTCSTLSLLTSSVAVCVYWTAGVLPFGVGVSFFISGVIGAFLASVWIRPMLQSFGCLPLVSRLLHCASFVCFLLLVLKVVHPISLTTHHHHFSWGCS